MVRRATLRGPGRWPPSIRSRRWGSSCRAGSRRCPVAGRRRDRGPGRRRRGHGGPVPAPGPGPGLLPGGSGYRGKRDRPARRRLLPGSLGRRGPFRGGRILPGVSPPRKTLVRPVPAGRCPVGRSPCLRGGEGRAVPVAGPVGLHQVPLRRRPADQRLQLGRQHLGPALHVVAEPALPVQRKRRPDDRDDARLDAGPKYTAQGSRAAPVRSARVTGPAGSRVRSPKNSTSTPAAPPTSRSQSRHRRWLAARALVQAAAAPARWGSPASPAARESRRTTRTRPVAPALPPRPRWDARSAPAAPGPLPATEVRQGQDGAPPGGFAGRDVLEPLVA